MGTHAQARAHTYAHFAVQVINLLRAREIDEHAAAGHTQGIPAHNEEALEKAGVSQGPPSIPPVPPMPYPTRPGPTTLSTFLTRLALSTSPTHRITPSLSRPRPSWRR